MSCNCSSHNSQSATPSVGDNSAYPTLENLLLLDVDCGDCEGSEPCCEGSDLSSSPSVGTTLPASFTDARCAAPGEGLTLLARIGQNLARFTGSGFLQFVDGKAYLVSSTILVLRNLWHQTWTKNGGSVPVVGDPNPFPYGVVADKNGNLFGIRGFETRNSLHVWSYQRKRWETISPDEFPLEVSRRIFQSDAIELVGFDPVSVLNSPKVVRALKALSGTGIVYLQREAAGADPTPEGCEPCPDAQFSHVARVLEFPTIIPGEGETGRHRLVYSSEGLYWEPEEP